MKINIFGDSHVGALQHGWQHIHKASLSDSYVKGTEITFYLRHGINWIDCKITESDEGIHFYRDAVPGSQPVDYTIDKSHDLYVFSGPLHSAPFYRDETWRGYCPWNCYPKHRNMHAVSSESIASWSLKYYSSQLKFIERLSNEHGLNIAVVEPPKPLRRVTEILGIADDILSAVSNIHRVSLAKALSENGIPVINTPDVTFDESGYTLNQFSLQNVDDISHGNALYGAEVVKAIINFSKFYKA